MARIRSLASQLAGMEKPHLPGLEIHSADDLLGLLVIAADSRGPRKGARV